MFNTVFSFIPLLTRAKNTSLCTFFMYIGIDPPVHSSIHKVLVYSTSHLRHHRYTHAHLTTRTHNPSIYRFNRNSRIQKISTAISKNCVKGVGLEGGEMYHLKKNSKNVKNNLEEAIDFKLEDTPSYSHHSVVASLYELFGSAGFPVSHASTRWTLPHILFPRGDNQGTTLYFRRHRLPALADIPVWFRD